jgi:glycerophosphoryl diester phosphodiesterase
MNSIETLSSEVAALVGGNKIYDTYKATWKYLLESYVGGEEYRRAQHLTRYQLETEAEYNARLRATPLENHCASVISVYNSFLFREEPDREFGALEMLPELKEFCKDADMDGRSLDAFMKDVATWSSVFGHCWIMVSKPDVGAITRADEVAMGVRPYVSLLTPMVVLDWQWKRQPSGRYELAVLKYVEDINGDVRVIKEWTPETITTSTVDTQNDVIMEQLVEVNGLGKIPAVIAYNGRSVIRGIGVSDIADIADAQRFIYNATCECEQSIRLDSHPSLVKTPETQAGIGAGSLIHMPENLDPGLKPYLLEFSGASVDSIYTAIKHTIEAIDKMANTGAVRATEARTMSGVAMQTEFQLLNARLSEKADNLELAEEQMWKLWCEYMGYTWDGCIDYPGSFNIRDTQSEIDNLVKAKSAATDPRVIALIDHEIIEFLGEDGDIIMPEMVTLADGTVVPYDSAEPFEEPEELFNPATGETGWVIDFNSKREAMMAGWVEKEGDY